MLGKGEDEREDQGSEWDGMGRENRPMGLLDSSHPIPSSKKTFHPIPSHGIDSSSHPIPWVPWDNFLIKKTLIMLALTSMTDSCNRLSFSPSVPL